MIFRILLVLLMSSYSAVTFGAITVTFKETIPRNLVDQGFFDIELNIRDIVKSANTPSEFFGRMKFFLPAESQFAGGEITTVSERFRVSQYQDATSQENDLVSVSGERNFDGIVYLRVSAGTVGFDTILGENKFIEFKVSYKDTVNNQDFPGETKKLIQQVQVAKAAPSFESRGAHKRLDFLYEVDAKIDYTSGDPAAPTGVIAVAILHEADGLVLPSYRHEPDAKTDAPGDFCTYRTLENGGDCITCGESGVSDKNYYLDIARMKEIPSVALRETNDLRATGLSLPGLIVGQNYSTFMVYKPDGVVRSSCAVVAPKITRTLSELHGEKDAELEDAQCFIATAAYGTPLHHRINELRWFRDQYLKTNWLGSLFVENYYRYAPPIADFVANRSWLQALVRLILDPLTTLIASIHEGQESPSKLE